MEPFHRPGGRRAGLRPASRAAHAPPRAPANNVATRGAGGRPRPPVAVARPAPGPGPVRGRALLHHRAHRPGTGPPDPAGEVPRPAGPAPGGHDRQADRGVVPPHEPGPEGPGRAARSGQGGRVTPPRSATRSARGREVVAAGRLLLEQEGPEALTMRRLAERVGIRAPSLYKHLPDKAALEAAIIATGFEEAAATFERAVEVEGVGEGPDNGRGALVALAAAYRRFALEHPHLYRLMNNGPLPRAHLPPGLENRTAAPLLRAAGR